VSSETTGQRTRDPAAEYRRRQAEHRSGLDAARQTGERLVRARTALFLGAVAGLILWDFLGRPLGAWAALAAGAPLAVGFLLLVRAHQSARRSEARHATFLSLCQDGLSRLDRSWNRLPLGPPNPTEHPYAGDLQVFGRASLWGILGPVSTAPGQRTLADWLLAPAAPDEVRPRQEAVRELAPELDRRMDLAASGVGGPGARPERTAALLAWAEEQPWLAKVGWLRVAMWALPATFVTLAYLHATDRAGPLWLAPLIVQMWLVRRYEARMDGDLARAGDAAPEVEHYAAQISLIRTWSARSPRLQALLGRLETAGPPADARLRRLSRWLQTAENRHNAFQRLAAYLLLLHFHAHAALERWRAESGAGLRDWLDALGEVEALAALATLSHDHPSWAFPDFSDEPVLVASALAHPLLHPQASVGNDVRIGPPGTFLLVTGSNMSGKSTLLRALGLNVVLASAGAPVCARALRLPPVALQTSIRVQDSLEAGVSLFMAELLALARIVEAAKKERASGEAQVFYLVDEMLQGTNSAERRVAARTVLRHLLAAEAIGVVTTHDLTLAASPDLEARAETAHFRETAGRDAAGRPRLNFDYQLRPGLATTSSALKLLEMVGLGDDGGNGGAGAAERGPEGGGDDDEGHGGAPGADGRDRASS